MSVKKIPHWISCPPAETVNSIWSMAANDHEALYSSVLAVSLMVWNMILIIQLKTHIFLLIHSTVIFQENWDPVHAFPDLRLLIIEPSQVSRKSLKRVEEAGWGVCRVKRLPYFKVAINGIKTMFISLEFDYSFHLHRWKEGETCLESCSYGTWLNTPLFSG